MTNRAVRGVATTLLGSPLALWLAAGCGMGMDDEMEEGAVVDESQPDGAGPGEDAPDQDVPDQDVGDEGAGDETGDIEQGLTTLMGVNFESYAVGSLSSPWSQMPAASLTDSRAVIQSTSDHGKVLAIEGSAAMGDYLTAKLDMSISTDIVASVDVNPDSSGAFVWSVHGQGGSTYKRRVRLQRWPGSTRLIATASPAGDRDCGSLASARWTKLTLVIHTQTVPSTFDVLIDGNRTACTGLQTSVTPPFTSVQIMDASNSGWGGRVRFDNIQLARP
jgi:hypothetical protein